MKRNLLKSKKKLSGVELHTILTISVGLQASALHCQSMRNARSTKTPLLQWPAGQAIAEADLPP